MCRSYFQVQGLFGGVVSDILATCGLPSYCVVGEAHRLWFTSDFRDKHRSLFQLLHSAMTWPGSRWSLAVDAGAADIVLTTKAAARDARHVHGATRVQTGRDLLQTIAEVDLEATGGTS